MLANVGARLSYRMPQHWVRWVYLDALRVGTLERGRTAKGVIYWAVTMNADIESSELNGALYATVQDAAIALVSTLDELGILTITE